MSKVFAMTAIPTLKKKKLSGCGGLAAIPDLCSLLAIFGLCERPFLSKQSEE